VSVTVDDTGAVTMLKKMNDVRGHRASLGAGWRNTDSTPPRCPDGGRRTPAVPAISRYRKAERKTDAA